MLCLKNGLRLICAKEVWLLSHTRVSSGKSQKIQPGRPKSGKDATWVQKIWAEQTLFENYKMFYELAPWYNPTLVSAGGGTKCVANDKKQLHVWYGHRSINYLQEDLFWWKLFWNLYTNLTYENTIQNVILDGTLLLQLSSFETIFFNSGSWAERMVKQLDVANSDPRT